MKLQSAHKYYLMRDLEVRLNRTQDSKVLSTNPWVFVKVRLPNILIKYLSILLQHLYLHSLVCQKKGINPYDGIRLQITTVSKITKYFELLLHQYGSG